MAQTIASLQVELSANISGFKKAMADVTSGLDGIKGVAQKTGEHVGGLTDMLGKVGLAGLGFDAIRGAGEKVLAVFSDIVTASSDMNESTSKAGVVFGEFAGEVLKFTSTSAQSMGISSQKATEMAGTFGNLFTALGLGKGQAAGLSKEILTLGADLASFNNISVEDALEKLKAGLIGESEPLRSVGVNLNEAAVAAKALSMGLGDATGKLTDAEKVQARYALILEQTKNAQGDFGRTSTGMANSLRIIDSSFADLKVTIGNAFLPTIAPLISAFAVSLPGAIGSVQTGIQGIKSVFDAATPAVAAFTGFIVATQGPMLAVAVAQGIAAAATGVWTVAQWALNAALSANPLGLLVAGLAALVVGLKYAYDNSETFRNIVDTGFAAVSQAAVFMRDQIGAAFTGIAGFWQNTLQPALASVWGYFTDNILPVVNAVANVVGAVFNKAWEAASAIFQNVLLPALQSVGNFIRDTLQPALTSMSDTVSTKAQPVFKTLGDFFDQTLGPGLKTVNEYFGALGKLIKDTVAPAVQSATDGAFKFLADIIDRIGKAVQDATRWLNDLATTINSIKVPGWAGGNTSVTVSGDVGANKPHNAFGTNFWQGGETWVGETGPELVRLPRGSQIIPNNQAGSATVSVVLNFYGKADVPEVRRAAEQGVVSAMRSRGLAVA